jgi:hypothetical protein
VKSRVTISCLLAACALVACSGDDDTADPTTTATSALATTIAEAPTVATPTTATAPSSTAVATTTSVPTTAPIPTTAAAPTSTGPLDEAEAIAAIIETAQGAWRAYHDALLDPQDETKVAGLAQYYDGPILDGLARFVEDYRANGYRLVENPTLESSFTLSPLFVTLDLEDGLATVVGCHVNGYVKVHVGANPDGSDRVLDDSVIRRMETRELQLVDGRWKVTAAALPPDNSEVLPPCV